MEAPAKATAKWGRYFDGPVGIKKLVLAQRTIGIKTPPAKLSLAGGINFGGE
jgi:hypothetical protein